MTQILAFAFSEKGPREDNQDRILEPVELRPGVWLVAIADGVGGAAGGGEAAKVAIETIRNAAPTTPFNDLISAASKSIAAKAKDDPSLSKMATTLTLLLIENGLARIAHVGDTRIYHLRGMGLNSLTQDQTEVAELRRKRVLTEYQLKRYPRKNVLTSALSPRMDHTIFEGEASALVGDRFILLSDGVYGVVTKKAISDLSISSPDLPTFGRRLKEKTESSSPHDNFSAVVVECV